MQRNRVIVFFLVSLVVFFSCRPFRKVHVIKQAINKKDTVQVVIINEAPRVDSIQLKTDLLNKVNKRKIDFNTFSAKVKVQYVGQETNQSAVAYIKIKKDSIILISVVGPLGIVGLQAQVTLDSIIVINKIDRYVQRRSISYLNDVTEIPFDFFTLQDLVVGNPIFLSNNLVSYKNDQDHLLVLMVGKLFKNLITLDTSDCKPLHIKLDDVDLQRNRTCDITYSDYQERDSIQFSNYRSISVAEKYRLDVYLDFKQHSFNEPLAFIFNIPKNYKLK